MTGQRNPGVSDGGTGERLERARRFRKMVIIGGILVVGIATGFLAGMRDADALFTRGATDAWPPAMAIGIALSFLAAVIGGGIALGRQTDEVERLAQYKAAAAAALAYMLTYPVWFALWMGELAPEPMHGALFGLFWLTLLLALLFYKFR